MFFKDVIGQEEAKQRLIAEVKEGRIPHAQLICGPGRYWKVTFGDSICPLHLL